MQYLEVAVALPVQGTFTYRPPDNCDLALQVGLRVIVPFGRRRVTGYVLGPSADAPEVEIKPIQDVLDDRPLFPAAMVPFFRWIAAYYLHPLGEVIKAALPGGLNPYEQDVLSITTQGRRVLKGEALHPTERVVLDRLSEGPLSFKRMDREVGMAVPRSRLRRLETEGWVGRARRLQAGTTQARTARYVSLVREPEPGVGLSTARRAILGHLQSGGTLPMKRLSELNPNRSALIRSLAAQGYLAIETQRVYRDPFGEPILRDRAYVLNNEQEHVFRAVLDGLGRGFIAYLLAGVTGSGKTEIYLQLAAEAVRRGLSVLVLVPEIALISQMERRFRARFGERIAMLHSGLSAGERFDQWERISHNQVAVAIGARSAIFAPFARLGLVIVDEEHDGSYKQEKSLRYNARDLAVVRAKLQGGIVLLGSATPSIQSYYNVTRKKFVELSLRQRVEKRPLPRIQVVDLRESRDQRGVRRFISAELASAMAETLARGEQVLLFLNRRGFAGLPLCASCGEALRCQNCDISMTLHRGAGTYKCHYCGFRLPAAAACRHCGSGKIQLLGLGTEKVESAVTALFPSARVARMDRDTTAAKGSLLRILKALRSHTVDVLIGTQMVAKGHDFPLITLVGIVCADLSLNFPDFRAGERTFQLLAQVAGRAGRGETEGRVILQTYAPDHFSIQAARDQDFKPFYEKEIVFRKELKYPPFSRLVHIGVSGRQKASTARHAQALGEILVSLQRSDRSFAASVEILGPVEAPLPRIDRHYRWQLLLKGVPFPPLQRMIRRFVSENVKLLQAPRFKVVIDIDPYTML